jgi:hypothetical protein
MATAVLSDNKNSRAFERVGKRAPPQPVTADSKSRKWLRKRRVQERYDNVSSRTIDRAAEDGRLPKPHFPFGNKIPFWAEDELDSHDRKVAASRMPQATA